MSYYGYYGYATRIRFSFAILYTNHLQLYISSTYYFITYKMYLWLIRTLVNLQLLALQTALSSTMKAYYEHRGAKSRRDLASFARNAATSYTNVEKLQKQFELVLSDIDGFLNKHTSAQVQLISKHRGGSGKKDEGMTSNGREMRKAVSQGMSEQSHHHKRLLLTNGEINSERRHMLKTELPPITSGERSSPKSVTFNLPVQCPS